ncbi:uncharacterized protein TNCV_3188231 [Trichonephila clavipes]|nr:uncharacterized protein TNCV_3188231 [Trichonephila clavipes]
MEQDPTWVFNILWTDEAHLSLHGDVNTTMTVPFVPSLIHTKIRKPSTDQSLRRPPHGKKCIGATYCFIAHHPGTASTFSRSPCVFSNQTKAPGWRTFEFSAPIPCAALDAPTNRRLRLEWCRTLRNCTAADWNQVVFNY